MRGRPPSPRDGAPRVRGRRSMPMKSIAAIRGSARASAPGRRAALASAGALLLGTGSAPARAAAQGGNPGVGHKGRPMIGVYVGQDVTALREFESLFGRR